MENIDVMVLRTLRDWRAAGKRALLATVVRTWGSSPRPIGSIMALCEDGAVVGSVSVGCIEDDLIYRFTRAYSAGPDGKTADGEQHEIPSGAPGFVNAVLRRMIALRGEAEGGAAADPRAWRVLPVRPGDYSRLFARMRRGGSEV